jgi:hypothetical protein
VNLNPAYRGTSYLTLYRILWVIATILVVVVILASIPMRFSQLSTVTLDAKISAGQLSPKDLPALRELNLTPEMYALYFTILEVISAILFLCLGTLIFWLQPINRMPLLFAVFCVTFGLTFTPLTSSLQALHPIWDLFFVGLRSLGFASFFLAFYLFPDGQFLPGWTRWLALSCILFLLISLFYPPMRLNLSMAIETKEQAYMMGMAFAWGTTIVISQIYRYKYRMTVKQRQQAKWVVLGLSVIFFAGVAAALPVLALPVFNQSNSLSMLAHILATTVILFSLIVWGAAIAIAVLRHRLFDIDLILRRTLLYTLLTVILGGTYVGIILIFQTLLTSFTGQQQTIGLVISTLVTAALFTPLRRAIQNEINRRFYRNAYDAQKKLENFSNVMRDQVDLDQVTHHLLETVDETMHPETISFWIRKT